MSKTIQNFPEFSGSIVIISSERKLRLVLRSAEIIKKTTLFRNFFQKLARLTCRRNNNNNNDWIDI